MTSPSTSNLDAPSTASDAQVRGGTRLVSILPRRCLPPILGEIRTVLAAAGTIGMPVQPAPATIGEGRPVLMIPGLGAGDSSLLRARNYLRACEYEVWRSHITCNVDCSETAVGRLLARLERVAERTGQRVALVGHSRGGLLARVLSRRRPDLVAGTVALGSPFRDQLAVHPVVWAELAALGSLGSLGVPGIMRYGCAASDCCASFRRDLAAPVDPRVGYLAVFSRRDGIVDWRACVDTIRRNLEVPATHIGMILDGGVLAEVANAIRSFHEDERGPAGCDDRRAPPARTRSRPGTRALRPRRSQGGGAQRRRAQHILRP
jgi:pimeloyl-ACP methyl ester carboxylesterase